MAELKKGQLFRIGRSALHDLSGLSSPSMVSAGRVNIVDYAPVLDLQLLSKGEHLAIAPLLEKARADEECVE